MEPSRVVVFGAMLLPQGNRRFTEPSVEMNFASEFRPPGTRVIWWALTEAEERTRGFDASAYAGGRGYLFQFKAAHEVGEAGPRFYAGHEEMRRLRHVAASPGAVFYVLPTITSWTEFYEGRLSLLSQTWLLDVHQLPARIRPPQRLRGRGPRRSGMHYIELTPPTALVRSEPITARVEPAEVLLSPDMAYRRFGEQAGFSDVEEFLELVRSLSRGDGRPERTAGARHRGLAAALVVPSYFLE
jgi:hypothetical protein